MSNIYYARRGNKIVRIDDNTIEKYKGAGYVITDMNGKLVTAGTPRGVTQLTSAYNKLTAENESLKAENESLKEEISSLQAQIEVLKKVSEETRTEAPKRARSKKTTEE